MDLNGYIESQHDQHLSDLYELLRIPSVSAQTQHKADIEKAAQWVAERLRRAGLKTVEIVPTKLHPLVYGESLQAPGKPTVLFYGHYDVQPPEPLDLWTSPAFVPTIRDGNLYALCSPMGALIGRPHHARHVMPALEQPGRSCPACVSG